MFTEMASEEQVWRNAAQTVLRETQQGALHYLDIKRMILEKGLVGPGLQTTLESVLFKDVRGDLHQTNAKAKFSLIFDTGRYEQCVNFFKNLPASDISFTFTFVQCRRTLTNHHLSITHHLRPPFSQLHCEFFFEKKFANIPTVNPG